LLELRSITSANAANFIICEGSNLTSQYLVGLKALFGNKECPLVCGKSEVAGSVWVAVEQVVETSVVYINHPPAF